MNKNEIENYAQDAKRRAIAEANKIEINISPELIAIAKEFNEAVLRFIDNYAEILRTPRKDK